MTEFVIFCAIMIFPVLLLSILFINQDKEPSWWKDRRRINDQRANRK